jgi:hypothetical protein
MKISNTTRNNRKLLHNDEDIVFEYFRLINNKDIERLMDLFAPGATIYEPFKNNEKGIIKCKTTTRRIESLD